MSKIFICHASEDDAIAESIQLALKADGYNVFFDDASLKAAADYNSKIISAIESCDLFIFLISKNSTKSKKFALSELKIAQNKWGTPGRNVLPVNIDNTPLDAIPAYLKATTILNPSGDIVIETKFEAKRLLKSNSTTRLKIIAITSIIALSCVVLYKNFSPVPPVPPVPPAPHIETDSEHYQKLNCKFGGRVGKAIIYNNSPYPAEIAYFHPNTYERHIRFLVNGQSSHSEDFNVGEDWGIKIGNRNVECLSTVAEWSGNQFIVSTNK